MATARRPLRLRPALGLAFGLLLLAGATETRAETLTGALEKVENGGTSVTLAGKTFGVSGSRTNVCIGGICDQGRDKLKTGQICTADVVDRAGKAEARRLSCK